MGLGFPDHLVFWLRLHWTPRSRTVKSEAAVTIQTLAGETLILRPIPMDRMPSNRSNDWLAFIGPQVPGLQLSLSTVERLQTFMIENETECFSDGKCNLTIAGRGLSICFPEAVPCRGVRP